MTTTLDGRLKRMALRGRTGSRPLLVAALLAAATTTQPRAAVHPDPAAAQEPAATWAAYMALPSVSAFAWSPRGTQISFAASTDGRPGIYVIEGQAGASPRRLADGSAPAWAPNGSTIAFQSGGDLWTVPATGGTPTRVTNDKDEEREFEWSADGSQLVFMSARSRTQDVWAVPAAGGPPRQITQKSMDADEVRFGARWSPAGDQIAFVSNQAVWDHDDLYLVPSAGGTPRRLTRLIRARGTPVWSPDGKQLAVIGFRHEEFSYGDMADLYVIDVRTGRERKLDLPVFVTGEPAWSPDGRELLFTVVQYGETDIWRVALDEEKHPTRVTYVGGGVSGPAFSADGKRIAFMHSSPVRPNALYVMAAGGGEPIALVDVAPPLTALKPPRRLTYRTYDGKYIDGFLYLPPNAGEGGTRFPALVQVHGGGTNAYRNGFNPIEQVFALKGYIVLAINFRGSSSYGRGFQDLSTLDWGGGQAHDAAMAAQYLRTLSSATGKVGIYGYSYGGMMAMAAAVRHPDAFDAVVAMAGIYDPVLAYGARDRVGKLFTQLGHGGPPDKNPAAYQKSAAINKIMNLKAPVLVMHGEADVRVPFNQVAAVTKALIEHRKVYAVHTYPGEPHGFRKLENRIDLYTRCEAWLEKYLKQGS